jgi:membrane protease YdiL (CAAX protease family)
MPRSFVCSLAAANVVLIAAGAVYAQWKDLPASVAAPVVAAFLLQFSFYLAPGVPEMRRWLEARLPPAQLGAALVVSALLPYLVYSLPTGVFDPFSTLKLAAIAAAPALIFVLWPTRRRGLAWQDAAVLATVAVVEFGKLFRGIYASPMPDLRIDILGRFMLIGVGATAYLSLRRLEGEYRLLTTWRDWKTGFWQAALFLPAGLVVGYGIGFGGLRTPAAAWWMFPFLAAGTFLGIYLAVALFEELFLRGVLQNLAAHSLGRPVAAQALVSVVSGLAHLPFRDFPNWRFALLAALAHWFYGQAWRQGGLPAACVAHALVVTLWRMLFSG